MHTHLQPTLEFTGVYLKRAGLVVERRTPEREVAGSILAKVAVLYH